LRSFAVFAAQDDVSVAALVAGGQHLLTRGVPEAAVGLGFYVAKPYWGRGLATEAARVFVDYGFQELKLQRIISSVEVGSAASVRVLQKLGFRWLRREEREPRSFDHFELRNS